MPACFVVKHVPGCPLHVCFLQRVPVRKNQMDVIVGHGLVMVERRRALHAVFLAERLRKQLEQKVRIFFPETLRKGNDQLTPLNAFSRLLIALPEIMLRLFRQILPELRLHCAVRCIQMLLSFRVADVVDTPPNVGQATTQRTLVEAQKKHDAIMDQIGLNPKNSD